ncbi:hypothetical protein NIES4073_30430 [Kalymmatonema gypsitolerans NIES-4073]|nr:hypothetical protein NIES4073_30430 [Scytonema sp. NIES-4073]
MRYKWKDQNLPSPLQGEGIKGWGKPTWDKPLNVIVDTNGIFPRNTLAIAIPFDF